MLRESKGPDFIGIGGGRCGSTWLYENLRMHPQIWLPPIKELHYFDRDIHYPSPSILYEEYFLKRVLGIEKHNIEFKKQFVRSVSKEIVNRNIKNLKWKIRYFTKKYDDEWYASLFPTNSYLITGEITPAYSILNNKDVKHIKTLFPNAKIIFLMRNPIDRTWSQIRKNGQSKLGYSKIKEIIEGEDISIRNDYLRTIEIWTEYYDKDHIFLGFYDEIICNPKKLIKNILNFLGLGYHKKIDEMLSKKVNKSINVVMPEEIKVFLNKKLGRQIEEMSRKIGGYAENWHKNLSY